MAAADRRSRFPARRRQALHRQLHDGQGVGEAAAGGEEGISFTEFSYQLLQAYDYLVAARSRSACTLQMGGSDQWGNITAGCDLIRKVRGAKAHGLVWPLMTTAGGREVRQDRGGHDLARSGADLAVPLLSVLAEHRRSRRREVRQVLHLARSRDDRRLERAARSARTREAQRTLAREVTTLVHGRERLATAERASAVLFGSSLATRPPTRF